MHVLRWMSLAVLLALPGCDVGTAAMLLSKDKGGGDDDPAPLIVSAPEPDFQTWVTSIVDDADGDAAKAELIASNGTPGPRWKYVESGWATTVIDPALAPTEFNTILTRVNSTQNYKVDSYEILDDQDRVVEHASGTVWSNLVTDPDKITGTPDGSDAVTTAVEGTDAFVFTRYAGPIEKFRVSAQPEGGPIVGGNVLAVGSYSSSYGERPGGMAIDANGRVNVTLTVGNDIRLARFGLDAVYVDSVELENDIKTNVGSHSVAIRADGEIYTACTIYDGKVLVQQNHPNLTKGWNRTFYSGKHLDRVEANGIAVDGAGDVVIAGGMNSSAQGVNHWLAKASGANGSVSWEYEPSGDLGDNYWHAVATGPGNLIYTAGNYRSGVFNVVQILTGRFLQAGSPDWEAAFGDIDAPVDFGHAVTLDSAGNTIMAGSLGTSTVEGRNGVLVRYGTNGTLSDVTTFSGASLGDDEILDIAVDPDDGSIYAVGYETVSGQGQNWWVRKYDANFIPVWTRTHDGGAGDDRAISVAVQGDQVAVAGLQTVPGGLTKFVLRVYSK